MVTRNFLFNFVKLRETTKVRYFGLHLFCLFSGFKKFLLRIMKIWLIEDSDIYRKVLGRLLETCTPYAISKEFSDENTIDELLNSLSMENTELPDLFLLDLSLPKVNGWEILDSLVENKIDKPVIIISQSNSKHDIDRSNSYPNVAGYFVKGDFPANLFAMIGDLDTEI